MQIQTECHALVSEPNWRAALQQVRTAGRIVRGDTLIESLAVITSTGGAAGSDAQWLRVRSVASRGD